MPRVISILFLAVAITLTPHIAKAKESIHDPYENFNRKSFAIHLVIDKYLARPIASAYTTVLPNPVRRTFSNVLRTWTAPVSIANDAFQGNWSKMGTDSARFGINMTIGIFGIIDMASHLGFKQQSEDFGQTLAKYGVGSGPYLFIPLLGPSTPRHLVGRTVDTFLNPTYYFSESEYRDGIFALDVINTRSELLEPLDDLAKSSSDLYTSYKSFYWQNRQFRIQDGATTFESLPDISDLDDE